MARRRTLAIAALAVSALTVSACGDDDDDDGVGDAVGDAADSLVDAGGDVVDSVVEAGGEVVDDATETAVRNFAAQQGEEQFSDADQPLDEDGLTCEATVADGRSNVSVECTGTTEDGGAAVLSGETSELPGASITELEGTFTGTVDGDEVFSAETLGG